MSTAILEKDDDTVEHNKEKEKEKKKIFRSPSGDKYTWKGDLELTLGSYWANIPIQDLIDNLNSFKDHSGEPVNNQSFKQVSGCHQSQNQSQNLRKQGL